MRSMNGWPSLSTTPAAEDHPLQVEQGRGVAHRQGQGVRRLVEQLDRGLVAIGQAPGQVAGLDGSAAGQLGQQLWLAGLGPPPHLALDPGPPGVALQMAATPAATRPPAGLDGDVADLAGHPPLAVGQAAVDDQAAPHTGPDEHRQQVVVIPPGAEAMLGNGPAVDVVGHDHRAVQAGADLLGDGHGLVPAGDVGAAGHDAVAIDEAGHPDADADGLRPAVDRGDRVDQGVEDGVGSGRCDVLHPARRPARTGIDGPGEDLGAAEVDPDDQAGARLGH